MPQKARLTANVTGLAGDLPELPGVPCDSSTDPTSQNDGQPSVLLEMLLNEEKRAEDRQREISVSEEESVERASRSCIVAS